MECILSWIKAILLELVGAEAIYDSSKNASLWLLLIEAHMSEKHVLPNMAYLGCFVTEEPLY